MTAVPRRELATRQASWARRLASLLARAGVRPNAVSIAGVAFAWAACAAFVLAPPQDSPGRALLLVAAAASIQLRLLCNLLDGMLAVEHRLKTKHGELFNEIPDRIADLFILVGAGCSLGDQPIGFALGCAAGMTALFTAYVRVLGGSLGVRQHFTGPMAKQHRMFVMTVAALAGALETIAGAAPHAMAAGLVVVIAGAVLTAFRRVVRISHEVEAR
jgi:phosphatidylglycerophosphate synthase